MAAVNWELFTKVVGRGDSFQSTNDVGTKFEPKTVRVKPALPTTEELGEIFDSAGTGFGITLTTTALDGEVPGLLTVIESGPRDARSAAGTVKSSCVLFPPLLFRGLPPFTCTVEA